MTPVMVDKDGYTIGDRKYPRVTSILGTIAKPALTYWSAKMVAEFAVAHKATWTTLPDRDAINLLKGSPWSKRDAAGDRGGTVHRAIEAYLRGETKFPAMNQDERQVARNAIRFLQAHKPEPIGVEVTVYSPSMGYAGTCDLPCMIDGQSWLLDWKTSGGVYPDYALQLHAYAVAERAIIDGEDVETPWKEPRLGIVHLTAKGAVLHEVKSSPVQLQAAWGAALAMHGWKEAEKHALAIYTPEIKQLAS